jgi:hypothetical protein
VFYKKGIVIQNIHMDKKTKKTLCGTCGIETNCEVIISESSRSDGDYEYPDEVVLLVTKCLGCNKYTVSEVTICDSDMHYDENGKLVCPQTTKIIYPKYYNKNINREKFIESFKTKIEELDSCCPPEILLILSECLYGYEFRLNTLSTVGLRMIVDSVCQEKEKSGEIPKAKIDNLLEEGYINKEQKAILEKIVDYGNDAAHKFNPLKNNNIEICFDVIEILLKNIYYLQKIKNKLPKSKRNKR